MSNPKRVGEGSYGCVHNPPLKCINQLYNPDPTKVSKILRKKDANSELKEFKLINKADKKEDFHLGNPGSCFPDNNEINESSRVIKVTEPSGIQSWAGFYFVLVEKLIFPQ